MTSALLTILSEPAIYIILTVSLATVIYASYRANESLFKHSTSNSHDHAPTLSQQIINENTRMLEAPMALALPVIATISILFLFFFLQSVGIVLTALSTISAFASITFLFWPLADSIVRRFRALGYVQRSTNGCIEMILVLPFSIMVIITWLFTGNWLSNNIIGIALCIIFASLCKVPNLKTCSVLFMGLFVYDIFFVFFSERFFGKNVMVEVATTTPTNPASIVADYLQLPISPVKTLAMPAKLIIPAGKHGEFILGLGDIILPEVFLVYLQEIDLRKRTLFSKGYFVRACVAYALALLASFYFNQLFQMAQPALLYIVPAIIIPSVIIAKFRGELNILWLGPDRGERNRSTESNQCDDTDDCSSTQSTALLAAKQTDSGTPVL